MPGLPNPKNYTSAAAVDLNLSNGIADTGGLADEEEKKKKALQMQREKMGQSGSSVFGLASMQLFPDAGGA